MKNRLFVLLLIFIFLPLFALLYLAQDKAEEKKITIKEVLIQDFLLSDQEIELTKEGIIEQANFYRKENGFSLLIENDLLNQLAQKRAKDMLENNYFDHVLEEEFGELAQEIGYNFLLLGENIAKGNFLSNENLVNSWMNSDSHRENILNEKYEEIGIVIKEDLIIQVFGLKKSNSFFKNEFLLASVFFQNNLEKLFNK